MPSINLRVYRRSQENIALLFNAAALTEEQRNNIKIYASIDGKSKLLTYVTDQQPNDTSVDGQSVVLLINHALNNLSQYSDYQMLVEFGTKQKVTQAIYVYAFQVLPPTEKEDKKANRHMFGWSEPEKKWAKLNVKKLSDGTYALPVVLVDRVVDKVEKKH